MAPRIVLLVAVLATVLVLACWDNRRQMQRVLDEGYATTAQITGAQYQRKAPLVADGWWPRFVEQEISVDLTWQGKDGKPHSFRKVPVSEGFSRSIVNGDQVRLAVIPVKVLDDESAVPVVTTDAAARLTSLQEWLAGSGYAALAAWAGFALLTVMHRRRVAAATPGARSGTSASAADLPPRRTFAGLAALVVGGFLAFSAWSEGRSGDATSLGGQDVTADIISATALPGKDGGSPRYTLLLSWKDGQGSVHHFGPTVVSKAFWDKITKDGALTAKTTVIRYRPEDTVPRPLIVDDAPEERWQTRLAMGAGLGLMVLGLALLFSAMRYMRSSSRKS